MYFNRWTVFVISISISDILKYIACGLAAAVCRLMECIMCEYYMEIRFYEAKYGVYMCVLVFIHIS